jgi:hypothetical protein
MLYRMTPFTRREAYPVHAFAYAVARKMSVQLGSLAAEQFLPASLDAVFVALCGECVGVEARGDMADLLSFAGLPTMSDNFFVNSP